MATVQVLPATVQRAPAERIVLHGVSWRTYESLLADYPDCQAPRFAYDRGTLEIVVTISSEHEEPNRTLATLVEVVTEEWAIELRNVGSMTFKRKDLKLGFEPDSCFYIRNEPLVRSRARIDPAVDPPPDLTIEVDVTSYSLDRFPIYAGFGVPEVWRCAGGRVAIHTLDADSYRESEASSILSPLTSDLLSRFLAERQTLGRLAWLRTLREWARQHRPGEQSAR